jgi:hypothetical protein
MSFKKQQVTMGGPVVVPDYEIQLPDETVIRNILKLFP